WGPRVQRGWIPKRWGARVRRMSARRLRILQICVAALVGGWISVAEGAPEAVRGARAAGESARRSAPIASFTGGAITVGDLEDVIAAKRPTLRAPLDLEARKQLLSDLVRYDLLVLEAQRRGYREHALVIEAGKRTAITRLIER